MNKNMVKEPLLRFPGFDDEWKKVKLGEVIDRYTEKEYYDNSILLSSTLEGMFIKKDYFKTKHVIKDKTKGNIVKKGMITYRSMSDTGKFRFNIQNIVDEGVVSSAYPVFTHNKEFVDILFLINHLNYSHQIKEELYINLEGSTRLALSFSKLKNLKISLPSLEEQSKIGSFFKTLDTLIEKQESYIDKLENEKKGLLQDIFSRDLRLLDDNGEKFEGEWKEVKLGELEELGVLELKRGNVISKNDIAECPGNYPVYSSSILNNGYFGEYGKYMFNEELITWSVDGGGNFFLRKKHKFSITNVSGYIRILKPEKLTYGYLFNQLSYLHGFEEFNYINKAHPSVIRSLYNLNIPSLEEQKAIGLFFKKIDEKIEKEKELLEKYKEMKKGLLQDMFI